MKFQLFLALLPALTVLAAPIASLAEKPDVPDAATVFIAVAGKRDVQTSRDMAKREPAVEGAYARYVEAAEAHPKDILGK